MNKYQQALNCIKLTQVNFTDFGAFDLLQDFLPSEWIDTLQELIDNYSKLEAERNYMVMDNASLIDKNNQLEKALDIVCNILEHIEKDNCVYCPFDQKICVDKEQIGGGYCKANCWKEYAINKAKEEMKNG